jgi:phosphohistidine swiveling domain-containing protein
MDQNENFEDINRLFNDYQSISIKLCGDYFLSHNFDYFNNRLSQFSADFTSIRLIRNTWIDSFHLDSKKFLNFYEKSWEDREVPHYEDLIITICISIITGFFSNLLYDKYKDYRISRVNHQIDNGKILKSSEPAIIYLFKIYAIRESYINNSISIDQFKEIQKFLKSSSFSPEKEHNENSDIRNLYLKIWADFAHFHNLDHNLFYQFGEFIENYYDKNLICLEEPYLKIDTVKKTDRKKNILGTELASLNAMGVSKGESIGKITLCGSLTDISEFRGGEIGFFPYMIPEFVNVLRKCNGAVGGEKCGGMTGHLAIASRELGIPCAVGIRDDDLIYPFLGNYAIVDGENGIITIFSEKPEPRIPDSH